MAYRYYPASSSETVSPQQKYINDLQAKINDDWENASDIFTIQEESTVGQQDWQDVEVRIGHIVQASTGDKLGDDWRNIIFKDMTHSYGIGRRYQFDSNVWLTVNSDFHKYPTASTVIRRCNNLLRFYNNETLVKEPSVIDYKPYRNSVNYNNTVALQEGRIYVIVQNNEFTSTIVENQRFIFNQHAYKVIYVENYLQNITSDDTSSPLISFYMNIDLKSPKDDLVNGIAYNDSSIINPQPTPNVSENIISPAIDYVLMGQSQDYTVYHYVNTVVDDNTFDITASGVPQGYYLLNASDNGFSVQCLQMYNDAKLHIVCTNRNDGSTANIDISLKGAF